MADSENLQGVQRRRQSLYRATLDLEAALSSPTGDLEHWQAGALGAALELQDRIAAHVAESEQPGEFLDSITTHAPHLISTAKKLISEHSDLVARASDLVDQIEGLGPTAELSAAAAIRRSAMEFMGLLIRHRQRGTDLVYLAYGEDLGSSG